MLEDYRDEKLKHLLSLKRLEMPSKDRWLEFDSAFEDKRLSALNDSIAKRCWAFITTTFNFKRVAFSSVAAVLILILSFAAISGSKASRNVIFAKNIGREYVKFVSDGLSSKSNDVDLNSYVCSIRCADSGVNYVNDSMFTSQTNFSNLANL